MPRPSTKLERVHRFLGSPKGKTLLRENGLRRSRGLITRSEEGGDVALSRLAARGKIPHPRAFINLHETTGGWFKPAGRLKFEDNIMTREVFRQSAAEKLRVVEARLRQMLRQRGG